MTLNYVAIMAETPAEIEMGTIGSDNNTSPRHQCPYETTRSRSEEPICFGICMGSALFFVIWCIFSILLPWLIAPGGTRPDKELAHDLETCQDLLKELSWME